mmetsp:Transcript_51958/g.160081  ORF Transcript_51958/g.160081 Transcript_51958/m.160081 type:complete len:229 (+) Transcript_51958:132-818(+)
MIFTAICAPVRSLVATYTSAKDPLPSFFPRCHGAERWADRILRCSSSSFCRRLRLSSISPSFAARSSSAARFTGFVMRGSPSSSPSSPCGLRSASSTMCTFSSRLRISLTMSGATGEWQSMSAQCITRCALAPTKRSTPEGPSTVDTECPMPQTPMETVCRKMLLFSKRRKLKLYAAALSLTLPASSRFFFAAPAPPPPAAGLRKEMEVSSVSVTTRWGHSSVTCTPN